MMMWTTTPVDTFRVHTRQRLNLPLARRALPSGILHAADQDKSNAWALNTSLELLD
jgi:hypothetical protein